MLLFTGLLTHLQNTQVETVTQLSANSFTTIMPPSPPPTHYQNDPRHCIARVDDAQTHTHIYYCVLIITIIIIISEGRGSSVNMSHFDPFFFTFTFTFHRQHETRGSFSYRGPSKQLHTPAWQSHTPDRYCWLLIICGRYSSRSGRGNSKCRKWVNHLLLPAE